MSILQLHNLTESQSRPEWRRSDLLMLSCGLAGYFCTIYLRQVLVHFHVSLICNAMLCALVFPLAVGIGTLLCSHIDQDKASECVDWRFNICEDLLSKVCVRAFALGFLLFVVTNFFMNSCIAFLIKHHITINLEARQEMAQAVQDIMAQNRYMALVFLMETVILTPLAEEVFFRVALPRCIHGFGLPLIPSMLIAALLFSLTHSPAYTIPAMFLFAVIQQLYQQRFGTHFSVITHGLYNFAVFMILA